MSIVATTQQSRFHTETLETYCEDVDLKQLTLTVGDKELLTDADLRLFSGRRYGLVGANGSGKSTLLRAIGQGLVVGFPKNLHALYVQQLEGTDGAMSVLDTVMQADKEVLAWRQHAALLQDALGTGAPEDIVRALKEVKLAELHASVAEAALTNELRSGERGKTAQNHLLSLEAKLAAGEEALRRGATAREAEAAPALAQDALQGLADALSAAGADTAEARARKILLGLGFSAGQMGSPVSQLSGGWRMRAALAQALFIEPDILLLDEPTNHLDLPSILWLQGYLKTLEDKTVVLVSHDRAFLDETAQEIIVLRHNRLAYHTGNYSEYERNAQEKQQHMLRLQEGIDRKKAHMEKSIQEGLSNAKKTGDDKKLQAVASRKKKLDDRLGMEKNAKGHRLHINRDMAGYAFKVRQDVDIDMPDLAPSWKLPQPAPLRTRAPLIQLEAVNFAYLRDSATDRAPAPSREILRDITLCVEQGEKLALVGANGQGKSTLVKLMLGELRPKSGSAVQHPQARIGTFAQSNVEDLVQHNGHLTSLKHMKALFPNAKEQELRGHLGSFGIKGALATFKMSALSGGQAVRVGLAAVAYAEPHLLVLDEPTSHLDMQSIEALQTCLKGYTGGIVLVTHDQHFCNSVAEKVYLVEKRSLKYLKNGVTDYVRQLERQKRHPV